MKYHVNFWLSIVYPNPPDDHLTYASRHNQWVLNNLFIITPLKD